MYRNLFLLTSLLLVLGSSFSLANAADDLAGEKKVKVMIDVYSGVPNPVITVDLNNSDSISRMIQLLINDVTRGNLQEISLNKKEKAMRLGVPGNNYLKSERR